MSKHAHELAKRPDWKRPKNEANAEEWAKIKVTSLGDAFPQSWHRLAWLKDRDNELRRLLDYLEKLGLPMGADDWALRALLHIRRLHEESRATAHFLWEWNSDKHLYIERLEQEIKHARAMHSKHLPDMEIRCDWCGWSGARRIGDGRAACEDCLPESVLADSERREEGGAE